MVAIASAWSQFAICVVLIWIAGVRLLRYGDIIADRTGASRTWIGVILLASVTSLPELVSGVSSVTLASAPDIAIGDVLGSCVLNLAILTILDLFARGESVYRRVARGHVLAASFGIVLLGLTAIGIFLSSRGIALAIGRVGLTSIAIVSAYLIAIRSVFRYEREAVQELIEEVQPSVPSVSLREAAVRYALWSMLVVVAALWLPFVGKAIAGAMAWNTTFVASTVVAVATSTPEVVVSIAAARLGALNMAIGNLLGSNLFNLAILAVDDALYAPGPIFSFVDPIQAVSAMIASVMTGVAIAGLLNPPKKRIFGTVGGTSGALLLLFVLNALILAVAAR